MSATATKQTHLVNGYIRELKTLLSSNTIIPSEIIHLCIVFCFKLQKFFIESKTKPKTLHLLDITLLKLSKFVIHPSFKEDINTFDISKISIHCHVPKISQLIKIPNNDKCGIDTNKSYDALIGILNRKYPTILLFETDKISRDEIEYYPFISSVECKKTSNIMFCDKTYGLIYESAGFLYQSLLPQIVADSSNFTINFNFSQIYNGLCGMRSFMNRTNKSYCDMIYLPKQHLLFAIIRQAGWIHNECRLRCGLFNLKQNKWESCKYYTAVMSKKRRNDYDHVHDIRICYDEYRDFIYVVDKEGNVLEFDIHKKEWNRWEVDTSNFVLGDESTFLDGVSLMENEYELLVVCSGYIVSLVTGDKDVEKCKWQMEQARVKWMQQHLSNTVDYRFINFGDS